MLGRSLAHVKMLDMIHKVNADLIYQCDNEGGTPLFCARESGQEGAAKWLVEHGAEEAGEAVECAVLEKFKVQLIQMLSIISLTRPFISHISSSLQQ
jgi:uncharacterized membrane protein